MKNKGLILIILICLSFCLILSLVSLILIYRNSSQDSNIHYPEGISENEMTKIKNMKEYSFEEYKDFSTPSNAVHNWIKSLRDKDFKMFNKSLSKESRERYMEENNIHEAFNEWCKAMTQYELIPTGNLVEPKVTKRFEAASVEIRPKIKNQDSIDVIKEGEEWKVFNY